MTITSDKILRFLFTLLFVATGTLCFPQSPLFFGVHEGTHYGAGSIYTKTLDGEIEDVYVFDLPVLGVLSRGFIEGPDGLLYGTTVNFGDSYSLFSVDPLTYEYKRLVVFEDSIIPVRELSLGPDGMIYGYLETEYKYQTYIFRYDPEGEHPLVIKELHFIGEWMNKPSVRNMPTIWWPSGADGRFYSILNHYFCEIDFETGDAIVKRMWDYRVYDCLPILGQNGKFYGYQRTDDYYFSHLIYEYDPKVNEFDTVFMEKARNKNSAIMSLVPYGDSIFYLVINSGYYSFNIYTKKLTPHAFCDADNTGHRISKGNDGRLYTYFLDERIEVFDPLTNEISEISEIEDSLEMELNIAPSSNGKVYGISYGSGNHYILEIDNKEETPARIIEMHSNTEGYWPSSSNVFQAKSGTVFGTTKRGGDNGKGVLFSFDMETRKYEKLYDFKEDDCAQAIIYISDDNELFFSTTDEDKDLLGRFNIFSKTMKYYTLSGLKRYKIVRKGDIISDGDHILVLNGKITENEYEFFQIDKRTDTIESISFYVNSVFNPSGDRFISIDSTVYIIFYKNYTSWHTSIYEYSPYDRSGEFIMSCEHSFIEASLAPNGLLYCAPKGSRDIDVCDLKSRYEYTIKPDIENDKYNRILCSASGRFYVMTYSMNAYPLGYNDCSFYELNTETGGLEYLGPLDYRNDWDSHSWNNTGILSECTPDIRYDTVTAGQPYKWLNGEVYSEDVDLDPYTYLDESGCSHTIFLTFNLDYSMVPQSEMIFKYYPNPVEGKLVLELREYADFTVEIYDTQGYFCKSIQVINSESLEIEFPYRPGVYLLKAYNDDFIETFRVVKL